MSGLLAVVPARAGSKGIPGKALRPVAGMPLLLRTLRTLDAAGVADRVTVSTDCPEVRRYTVARGYRVLDRPAELATDDAPLIDVARHTVEQTGWEGTVGLFQPTCPLLTAGTVRRAVSEFYDSDMDWAITACPDPHLHWHDGRPVGARVNRQYRDPVFRESGAVQLMTAEFARTGHGTRGTLAISEHEALDIDTPDDLIVAERLLTARKRVHFVVAMGHQIGTGHFHRALALARALAHHRISWEWRGEPADWAVGMLASQVNPHEPDGADLVIFDCLEVPERDLLMARLAGARTVVFEADCPTADLTVNDLLDDTHVPLFVLRDEFQHLPEREHRDTADRVLVTFGGTDPSGLADRVNDLITTGPLDVQVIRPGVPVSMIDVMRWADLVVTSQGRTVLEAAAAGTPCISIAANEREARHIRLPGVTYLGLHSTVTDDQIRQAITSTLASRNLREEKACTARARVDGHGLRRLTTRIELLMEGLT